MEQGHGAKGKKHWLTSLDDHKEMYSIHKGKKEILLWCSGRKKDAHSDNDVAPSKCLEVLVMIRK